MIEPTPRSWVSRWARSWTGIPLAFALLFAPSVAAGTGSGWAQGERFLRLGVEQGLAHSTVWAVAQGQRGDLWVGTEAALQRWDGYRFTSYLHDPDDPTSLSSSEVMAMTVDRRGQLWLATRQDGLNRYDATTDGFVRYLGPTSPADGEAPSRWLGDLFEDSGGTLWIGTGEGLYSLDPERRLFEHRLLVEGEGGGNTILSLAESPEGVLWAGTADGLFRLPIAEGGPVGRLPGLAADAGEGDKAVTALSVAEGGALYVGTGDGELWIVRPLPAEGGLGEARRLGDRLPGMVTDLRVWEGWLWAATYGGGLVKIDPETLALTVLRHDALDPSSLASDRVMCFATDRSGGFWLGTREGLHQLHRERRRFRVLSHRGLSAPLGGGVVLGVEEDRRGDLWATGDGWVRVIDRATGDWRGVEAKTADGASIGQIEEVVEDHNGRLWLGGIEGLFTVDPPASTPRVFEPLAGASVRSMAESAEGSLWIGRSSGQGVDHLDPAADQLTLHYEAEGTVYSLLEDRSGRLWVGTSGGLDRHDAPDSDPVLYRHNPVDPGSLGHAVVAALLEDRRGRLWVGQAGAGLLRFDEKDGTFEAFRTRDGLPHDNVVGLLEDDSGYLWVATHAGLARFDPTKRTFLRFDTGDGLAGNAFLVGPNLLTRDGQMIFGAAGGLTIFDPDDFDRPPFQPPVVITEVAVDGETIRFDPQGRSELFHHQKAIAFEFTAFDFANPERIRYRQRLRGYDDWSLLDASHRRARYTNLDAGTYVFEVQAAGSGEDWTEPGAMLALRVHPSPWSSWWAYWLYCLAIVGGVWGYVRSQRMELERQRANAERERRIAERERSASQRLRAVDKLKDEFLANTSHELRTPLFGITGLAESLLAGSGGELSASARENLELIVASGQRLGHLVNDILDFSKMRHQSLQLSRTAVDLRPLVEIVLALSKPLAGSKVLELENQVPENLAPVSADENRLMQILHNLVGNAVKFTDRGKVTVSASDAGDGRILVRVSDTGPGIPETEHERVFEAFAQIEGTAERMARGTGLGLAVTRQLIELHGGTIAVEASPSGGACFGFDLPKAEAPALAALAAAVAALDTKRPDGSAPPMPPADGGWPGNDDELEVRTPTSGGETRGFAPPQPSAVVIAEDTGESIGEGGGVDSSPGSRRIVGRILVVDDEPINRRILTQHLTSDGHRVTSVAGGPEALGLITRQTFDLLLLDVMMPRMSGFEVCRILRKDIALDELPVIFLTAKGQAQDLVVGLAAGANDYLSKPVARSELLARVKTHLALLGVHRRLSRVLEERSEQVEERGRLLREREQLIGELEERHAELARFNYTVSHDLKNPLVTIRNFLGSLRSGLEDGRSERFEEDLGRLDRAANTMQRLLEDLDRFSRAGRHDGSLSPVDLGELIRAVARDLEGRLQQLGIELTVAPILPVVIADRACLAEALRQLLDNAIRFTADFPQPRIDVGVRHQDDAVVLTIADNGAGVDPRYHEKVFELFHRLDPSPTGGTGVGLALVRRIVETHGGRVWVESAGLGRGSIFCLRLPTTDLLERIRLSQQRDRGAGA